jgi:hypothetical protein
MIKKIISEEFSKEAVEVKNVLLRSSGMVDQAEIHIELSGKESLSDIEMLSLGMEIAIRAKIPSLEKIAIIPHSAASSTIADKSASTKMNALRNLKWRQSAFRIDRNNQKRGTNRDIV